MEDMFNQPDLFLVMSDDEMDGALTYAEELIGEGPKCVDIYQNFSPNSDEGQYKLSVNNIDLKYFILDENGNYRFEFPMMPYYCLIFFEKDGKRDCIALAIPVSIWPEAYDIEYVKSFFIKHKFKVNDYINKLVFRDDLFVAESEYSKTIPLDSPWTIRDKDTLCATLSPGEEDSAINDINLVDNISLITNANIALDFNATAIISHRFDTTKISHSTYKFPNALVIHTKEETKIPIYIGNSVTNEEIINILNENGLSDLVIRKEFSIYQMDMEELILELMPFSRHKENNKRK